MKKLFTFMFLVGFIPCVYATHLIGGDIQVKRVNAQSLTYQIIVNLYTDDLSGAMASEAQSQITVCVGEAKQTIAATRTIRTKVTNNVSLNIYSTLFTYAAPGTYTVSVALENRSSAIINFRELNGSFYIQTTFATNVVNSTPFLNSPIGIPTANLRQLFNYNVNAIDEDGDSLVYRLAASKQGLSVSCTSQNISDFKYPNEVTREGIFRINAKTGELLWNAPTQIGIYTFVIVVEEWRNGVRISETQRDMTLYVEDKGGVPVIIPLFEYLEGELITAIQEQNQTSILVYPTITKDKITVTLQQKAARTALFQIIDTHGKVVVNYIDTANSTTKSRDFRLFHLPSGLYFVNVISDKIFQAKFFKE